MVLAAPGALRGRGFWAVDIALSRLESDDCSSTSWLSGIRYTTTKPQALQLVVLLAVVEYPRQVFGLFGAAPHKPCRCFVSRYHTRCL